MSSAPFMDRHLFTYTGIGPFNLQLQSKQAAVLPIARSKVCRTESDSRIQHKGRKHAGNSFVGFER